MPRHGPRLVEAARWLTPLLLEQYARKPQGDVERALARLLRDSARTVQDLVRRGQLTVRARCVAARLAGQHGGAAAQAVLALLAADPEAEVRLAAEQGLQAQAGDGAPRPPLLRLYSLGPMEAYLGEERVQDSDWRSKKVKYLLAVLALHRGRPVVDDVLMETFWPDSPRAQQNLYWTVSTLRRVLGAASNSSPDYVQRTSAGLSLSDDVPLWHDMEELEGLLRSPREPDFPDLGRRLLELYRGPYLEGAYFEWVIEQRRNLERQSADLLLQLTGWAICNHRYEQATELGRKLVEIDPYCQDGHLHLMQAAMALGRPEGAVQQYNLCARLLSNDLNMEPSIPLAEQYQRARLSLP